MNGLISIWGSDVNKIRSKVQEIRSLVEKIHMSDVLRADFNKSLDIIIKLLNKGKNATANNRHRDEDTIRVEYRKGNNGGDIRPQVVLRKRDIPDAETT